MAQSVEDITCTQPAETQHDKEASVYQTDFSVTNRLLPPYNNTGTSSLPVPSVTISYRNGGSFQSGHPSGMPGWHSMIHTDQESISPKNYPQVGWRGPTAGPNLLPHISQGSVYPTVGYGGGEGPAPPSYPDQSPDSSTGLVSFSPKGDKENTMSHHAGVPGPSLSSGDKLAIRKFCQQVINPETACNEEESGEESDDGSSTTPSSHGEAESVDEPKKPKRTRTAFSNLQLDQLELAFSRSHYPDVFTREDLSNKLSIKEDRIQVWFQNRRARYRKQERTGSVSLRSKYRQKRLQKLQQNQAAAATMTGAAGMYASYYPSCGSSPSQAMLTSPQPVSPYMSGFAFPPNYIPNTLSASSANGSMESVGVPPTTVASPGYLPGFNVKGSIPLSGYMMGLNHNGAGAYTGTSYGPASHNIIATPVTQK